MAHYRCIQVSKTPLSRKDVDSFSIEEGDLCEFSADYWGYENEGDALMELQAAFGDSIVNYTEDYIIIDRDRLGAILREKFERWKSKVSELDLETATGSMAYMAMRPVKFLSTGAAIHEAGWNCCGENTWDYLTDMYHMRFKDEEANQKKTFKLYYGASIDFHV